MKYAIQYLLALMLLVFSTLISWYEGSMIRDVPWEWKYTAFFSKMFNGEVTDNSEISQLDHFIYAAKFYPMYPILILLGLSYILILSGYLLLKNNIKELTVFLSAISVIYVFFGITISSSPTVGGKYFTFIFLFMGGINLALATLFFFKMRKGVKKIGSFIFFT
ncbi:YjdJ family protein [Sporosarcina aquimarina]|uniref:YjdJ family protein n=1 Tax=Sporosarcina aquimarina TaxID=114975 RepID=UPI001C8E319F|nr:YjdJ family protein [Sporosarcina aquimarina]MBY0223956.1 YjdJ family protein [Sporosarcina aquimarina]